jgi:hypothetical protein
LSFEIRMIKIEFAEPKFERCECCGREIVRLTRFVYQDNDAFAVYYLKFTKGHTPKEIYGLIGLGEWGEDANQGERLAFPFKIWATESHYHVGLTEVEESPWSQVTYLGKILNRDESLKHKWIKDVFHITDHIVAEDKIVKDHFSD